MVVLKSNVLCLLTLGLLVSESFAHWWMLGYRKPRLRFRYRYKPSYYYRNKYEMNYRRRADRKSYTYMLYSKEKDADMPTFYEPTYDTKSYYRKPYFMKTARAENDDYMWKYPSKYRSKYYLYKPKRRLYHRKGKEDDSYMTYDKDKRYIDSHMKYAESQPTYEKYYQQLGHDTGKYDKHMDAYSNPSYKSHMHKGKKGSDDKSFSKLYDYVTKKYTSSYRQKKYLRKLFSGMSSMNGDDENKSYDLNPFDSYSDSEMYNSKINKYNKGYQNLDETYDTYRSYYTERKSKNDVIYPDEIIYQKDDPYFKLWHKNDNENYVDDKSYMMLNDKKYERKKKKEYYPTSSKKGGNKWYKTWDKYIQFLNDHAFGEYYNSKDKNYDASSLKHRKNQKYESHKTKGSYDKTKKEDEKYYIKNAISKYGKDQPYYQAEKKRRSGYTDKYHKSKREKFEYSKHKNHNLNFDNKYVKKDGPKYHKIDRYYQNGDTLESPLYKSYLFENTQNKTYYDKYNDETKTAHEYNEKTNTYDKSKPETKPERPVIYLDLDTLQQYFLEAKKSRDRENTYNDAEKHSDVSLFPMEHHEYDKNKNNYDKKDKSDTYGRGGTHSVKKSF